jgi:hypothetical protein
MTVRGQVRDGRPTRVLPLGERRAAEGPSPWALWEPRHSTGPNERSTDEAADRPEAVHPPCSSAGDDAFAALLARLSSLEDDVECLVPRVRGLRAGLLRVQAAVHGGLRRIDALEARHARGDSSAGR